MLNKGIGLSEVLACAKCTKPQTETRHKFCRACGVCSQCHRDVFTHPFYAAFYWPVNVEPRRESHA